MELSVRLRFSPETEQAFRIDQDQRYRWLRVLFFLAAALSWLAAPWLNKALFAVDPTARDLLLYIEWFWAFPVLILAALMPLITPQRQWIYPFNVAGTLTLWAAAMALHCLAQFGLMDFPIHMVSIAVLAVALFGGFRLGLMLLGSNLTLALAVLAVWLGDQRDYPFKLYLYEIAYIWLIVVSGLIGLEYLNRAGFVYRQYIRSLARTDGLTGLMNRGAFEQLYQQITRQAIRDRRGIAVALLDLDHFKSLNDRFGHALGDEALRQTGRALAQAPSGRRPLDIRARYGGEEFVLVWFDPQAAALPAMGEQILQAIRDIELSGPGNRPIAITASLGMAFAQPSVENEAHTLLQGADQALYQAKAEGRDRLVIKDYGTSVRP